MKFKKKTYKTKKPTRNMQANKKPYHEASPSVKEPPAYAQGAPPFSVELEG